MARKRMISPEIWESQDFSALSDLAKIVFISLFSHADDEGRGRADPTFIKNITFPYDENRRVADIKSALSEIARSMSVQFYSVNGIEYYFMSNWERWQKVEKPSKSKFPPPPYVGEGGDIHSGEKFGECSGNSRGVIGESSPTNRIEDNRIQEVSKKDKEIKESMGITRARKSYQELMDCHEIPETVQKMLWKFIQHCQANGQVVTNDRLQSLWFKLKKLYRPSDISGMVTAIRTAINKGYYDIKDGEGWIEQIARLQRESGIDPFGIDEGDGQ